MFFWWMVAPVLEVEILLYLTGTPVTLVDVWSAVLMGAIPHVLVLRTMATSWGHGVSREQKRLEMPMPVFQLVCVVLVTTAIVLQNTSPKNPREVIGSMMWFSLFLSELCAWYFVYEKRTHYYDEVVERRRLARAGYAASQIEHLIYQMRGAGQLRPRPPRVPSGNRTNH